MADGSSVPNAVEERDQVVADVDLEVVLAVGPVEIAVHHEAVEAELPLRCHLVFEGVADRLEDVQRAARLGTGGPGAPARWELGGNGEVAVGFLGEPPAED